MNDRLDHISAIAHNIGYCEAVEKLLAIKVPERAQFLRIMVCEMSRISGHFVTLANHALDIGDMSVFLYCFRERESVLELVSELCGSGLPNSYTRLGGVGQDISDITLRTLEHFVYEFPTIIDELEDLIDTNGPWLRRTIGVGQITAEKAVDLCLTGASLRGSGVEYDIRKHMPYGAYPRMDFEIPLGEIGDTYDRFCCRMEEIRQSSYILKQCIVKLPTGPILGSDAPDLVMPAKPGKKIEIDTLARNSLRNLLETRDVTMEGDVYAATEVHKGELGFYFISDSTGRPSRVHVRTPSFLHISAVAALERGVINGDLIAINGAVDVVLRECESRAV